MKEEINMVKIMLVCSAGMSTSLLVNKMITEAEKRGLEAKIWATSEGESANEFAKDPADVILVGPQVRYLMNAIKERTGNKVPVELIDMRTYGMMDGGKCIDQALKAIGK